MASELVKQVRQEKAARVRRSELSVWHRATVTATGVTTDGGHDGVTVALDGNSDAEVTLRTSDHLSLDVGDTVEVRDFAGRMFVAHRLGVPTVAHAALDRTTTLSIATGTVTQVSLNSVFSEPSTFADAANNRLVIPYDGAYQVSGSCMWDNNSTGTRAIYLYENGSATDVGGQVQATAGGVRLNFSELVELAAGDLLTLRVLQSSGGNLGVVGARFSAHLVAAF